ncbi:MAG: hypothetical protein IIB08_08835, partial [Bacteroidetes bacterium]|nr:hypothetical protein [Bacteroidota bacterium]
MSSNLSKFKSERREMWKVLSDYLLSHEEDISLSVNDFGDLKDVFKHVIGCSA